MSPVEILFLVGILLCGCIALFAASWSPWLVMLTGIGITVLGAAWGLDIANLGLADSGKVSSGLSQIFLAFSSVVGGGLVSAAFVELREKRRKHVQQ